MTWGGGHKGEGGAFLVSYGEGPHVSQGAGGVGEGGNGMWDPLGGAPGGGGIFRVLLGGGVSWVPWCWVEWGRGLY